MAAYKQVHNMLTARGLKPKLQNLDNEASKALQARMQENEIDYQLAPPPPNPSTQRRRTCNMHVQEPLHCGAKKHGPQFSTEPMGQVPPTSADFPEPRARLANQPTHLGTRPTPRGLPLQPYTAGTPGHQSTGTRKAEHQIDMAPHGVEGWYIGPALPHYRCYRVWIWATDAERIADTLAWFPQHVTMPFLSSSQAAIAAARDLVAALNNPAPASPICPPTNSQREQLHQLADIFTQHTANTPAHQQYERTPPPTIETQQTPSPPYSTSPYHLTGQQHTTSDGATPTSRHHCPTSPAHNTEYRDTHQHLRGCLQPLQHFRG
jgi:hypothetical protein